MDMRMKVDTAAAERAFDMLGAYAPRLAENALLNIASTNAAKSGAKAPGSLRGTVQVHSVGSGDVFALFYGPSDMATSEGRKGWWTNYGTGAQADGRRVKKPNRAYAGQRAQRWLKKTSKKAKNDAIANALLRAARASGFHTGSVA